MTQGITPDDTPSLLFYDKGGKPRFVLGIKPDSSHMLGLTDKSGKIIRNLP